MGSEKAARNAFVVYNFQKVQVSEIRLFFYLKSTSTSLAFPQKLRWKLVKFTRRVFWVVENVGGVCKRPNSFRLAIRDFGEISV